MTSNQPARRRRDKIDLGNQHLQLSGVLSAQKASVHEILAGERATVTQITSATTGVTLNAQRGVITTFTLASVAGATNTFVFTNSAISNDSLVLVSAEYPVANTGSPVIIVHDVAAGSCSLSVYNADLVAALNGPAAIHFMVMN